MGYLMAELLKMFFVCFTALTGINLTCLLPFLAYGLLWIRICHVAAHMNAFLAFVSNCVEIVTAVVMSKRSSLLLSSKFLNSFFWSKVA